MVGFPNAKINIGLHVTSKRPDGYHNLESIFYPVNLTDAIEIVKTDPRVVIIIIFPASLEFAPIASAITKLAIAVGQPKTINNIPRSLFLYPQRNAVIVIIVGIIIIFIAEAINASDEAFFRFSKFNDPPIPTNASGKARSAK